jgi:hypothetical protein
MVQEYTTGIDSINRRMFELNDEIRLQKRNLPAIYNLLNCITELGRMRDDMEFALCQLRKYEGAQCENRPAALR